MRNAYYQTSDYESDNRILSIASTKNMTKDMKIVDKLQYHLSYIRFTLPFRRQIRRHPQC